MAKAVSAKTQKVILTHPRTGSEFTIDANIYEPIKAAILQSLKGSKGKTFTEVTDDVVSIIRKKMPGFEKSIPWYTISIRLDLETKGIVETFTEKGKKLNRLNPRPLKGSK
ncbi:MAG: hypothetical protein JNK14_15850 [Chitinophagaceae bacterium]|nr:hypothetical protein [Chitinophagaceae bacterium]